jgi:oligo-alginate lyase
LDLSRRDALGVLVYTGSAFSRRAHNGLLASEQDFTKAKEKAERQAWARAILTGLLQRADADLSRPVDVPERAGQWGHWYVCKRDGVELITESPTRHKCPHCGTVYTGEPYDSVYIGQIHMRNSGAMQDLALAFAFTHKKKFADRTIQLLLAYADKYQSYPRHDNNGKDSVTAGRVTSQTLDESVWLIPVVWAYTLVRDGLATKQRTRIEENLLRPAAQTIIGPSFDHLPNIQCWKNSAIGCVGYALEDQELVTTAIENPIRGFETLMSRNVVDGLWAEGSLGYQLYALRALWPLAEAARRHGRDLFANENYRSLFDGPIGLALPNGDPPGFNDNPGQNLASWGEVYELAYARWKRPEYGRVLRLSQRNTLTALLYGVDSLPEGDCIPRTSVVFRKAGFAALRSERMMAAVRFGLHGGGHGHPDMLDIVTCCDGKLFGVDPGSIGYGAPLHGEWYRSTVAHNTVSVDETLQSNANGQLVAWRQSPEETQWEGSAEVYAGVSFHRELTMTADQIHDKFICKSEQTHSYDWAFHAEGKLTVSFDATPAQNAFGNKNGYQHIKNVRQGTTDSDWTAEWVQGDIRMRLAMKGEPGTTIFACDGPGRDPAIATPLILVRRRGLATVFDVTHSAHRAE